jgi:homoserine dehydrogenase
MNKNLKLGVFGFGCVGQGLYQVLNNTKGIKAEIVKICVKDKNKSRNVDLGLFTFDKDELLNNPDINVIVELIDDADAAYEIVKAALISGKAVVTANKKMVAEHLEELYELQIKYNTPLLYEASSCASIPIIRNLEEYYDNDLLTKVEGIFNGSSNYILSQIFNKNQSFNASLLEAQKLGFAESDPYLDISGLDSKFKLTIILAHTFGLFVKPEEFFQIGIENINEYDIKFAREKGCKIKLNAFCYKSENDEINAGVLPSFIAKDNPIYNVDDEYNGVLIQSIFSENQFFVGKGAGGLPTGSAVLSDISALTYDYKYEYKKLNQKENLILSNDFKMKIYLRYLIDKSEANKKSYDDLFIEIKETYQNSDYGYIIGEINYNQLVTNYVLNNKSNFIATI